ncbi:MAG: MATE family efflux transporter, partial [Alcanivorax sp.]
MNGTPQTDTASLPTLTLVRQLWQQTWPMAMGVMSLLGFYLVDSIFVARLGT